MSAAGIAAPSSSDPATQQETQGNSAVPSIGHHDGMKLLVDAQRKLEESLAKIEAQIRENETSYLEDTAHGNIIRGWEGYADLKGKKDALLKKVRPYTENERLFSNSSVPTSTKTTQNEIQDDTFPDGDGDEPRRKKKSTEGKPPKIPGKTPTVKKSKKRKTIDSIQGIEEEEEDEAIGV